MVFRKLKRGKAGLFTGYVELKGVENRRRFKVREEKSVNAAGPGLPGLPEPKLRLKLLLWHLACAERKEYMGTYRLLLAGRLKLIGHFHLSRACCPSLPSSAWNLLSFNLNLVPYQVEPGISTGYVPIHRSNTLQP